MKCPICGMYLNGSAWFQGQHIDRCFMNQGHKVAAQQAEQEELEEEANRLMEEELLKLRALLVQRNNEIARLEGLATARFKEIVRLKSVIKNRDALIKQMRTPLL